MSDPSYQQEPLDVANKLGDFFPDQECMEESRKCRDSRIVPCQKEFNHPWIHGCTDEKEKKIFRIYKEIQSGAVAKSYMRKGFLIYEEMHNYFPIYMRLRRPLVIYDFATAPL